MAALAMLCGCSLLLDTSEFRDPSGAAPDAGTGADDGAPPGPPSLDAGTADGGLSGDAGACVLCIDGAEPERVAEGQTTALLLRGRGLPMSDDIAGADVSAVLVGGEVDVEAEVLDWRASAAGTAMGVIVALPVMTDYAPGNAERVLRVTVRREGGAASRDIAVDALPELTQVGGSLAGSDLAARYSAISLTGPLTFTGSRAIRLSATRRIEVAGTLRADGADAISSLGAAGGPGGCAGGANDMAGGCQLGGGGAGGASASMDNGAGGHGGGGGCGTLGDAGSGVRPGRAGPAVCTAALTPFGAEGNRGHGGGGGGSLQAHGGGGGGGGGGAVELTAAEVAINGMVSARGGGGAGGHVILCQYEREQRSGAGGGGGGGVLMVRADTLEVGVAGALRVSGGPGRSLSDGDTPCLGRSGDGGDGRVRFDFSRLTSELAISDPAQIVRDGVVWRGPRLHHDSPRLVTAGVHSFLVRGDPESTYELRVDNEEPVLVAGNEPAEVWLASGLRKLCAMVPGAAPTAAEAGHCLSVAVVEP
ncbi:hypothetical protein [Haliangium ochraceum]|uniref:Uncharacterized protein n=1 Tax=Haliangium ochraceum (strain DSM 14365 / JCM 11303 / SMP-2) TaxID=502025 RepID=D0LWB1_HALO1|nr:hypothetical protein [Haliangium ochraceum]ACY16043.1 hypothetical protein Hoch_3541 [Haliangium ochraceum DSM 14365]